MTIDKAKPVTDQYGYVQYYEVPAQVQITVNLYENSLRDYLVAVGWYDVEPTEWGESFQDKGYTFLTPAGSLMEPKPRSEYRYEDGNANQLIPGQNYTFSLQTNLADAVYVDCGCRGDTFLAYGMQGVCMRYAGDAGASINPNQPSEPTAPNFTDVTAGAYYADAVKWAVDKEITTGTTATTFSPNNTCTTAQILTFLWRANGSPASAGNNASVPAGQYYTDAANWALEKGLTDAFSADTPATRAATVTYLWKLAGKPAADATAFTDVDAGAEYAQAVAWAVKEGITTGTSATTFAPDNTCTRGQIVTFLYRDLAQ